VISTVVNYDAFPFIDLRILPEKHAEVFSVLCILLSGSRQNNTALQIYAWNTKLACTLKCDCTHVIYYYTY